MMATKVRPRCGQFDLVRGQTLVEDRIVCERPQRGRTLDKNGMRDKAFATASQWAENHTLLILCILLILSTLFFVWEYVSNGKKRIQ